MAAITAELSNFLSQYLSSFGFLILSAIGLAVIFGMMGIINLAHGEFITIGAYSTALSYHAGLPLVVAMGVGVLTTLVFGLILEATVIRRLYGRLLDSMVATWGISLMVVQGLRIVLGSSIPNIGTPLGSVSYGGYSYSAYQLLLALLSLVVLGALYWLFTSTDFGLKARATIQDEEMARSLGIDTNRMYLLTFGLGSALAGLTGALVGPTMTLVPGMGSSFLVEAFVTVVVGGGAVLVGTVGAGASLGAIYAIFSNAFGTFMGRVALLVTTMVVIRIWPNGVTGILEKWRGSE